jgi:hypothetical protein
MALYTNLMRRSGAEDTKLQGRHLSRRDRLRDPNLALLLGKSLFDQIKLLPRVLAPCLIIGEHVVTAICRGAHQIHGLLAKLIAIPPDVVTIAERLPLSADGTSCECQT